MKGYMRDLARGDMRVIEGTMKGSARGERHERVSCIDPLIDSKGRQTATVPAVSCVL